jgi:hypothetical protein
VKLKRPDPGCQASMRLQVQATKPGKITLKRKRKLAMIALLRAAARFLNVASKSLERVNFPVDHQTEIDIRVQARILPGVRTVGGMARIGSAWPEK